MYANWKMTDHFSTQLKIHPLSQLNHKIKERADMHLTQHNCTGDGPRAAPTRVSGFFSKKWVFMWIFHRTVYSIPPPPPPEEKKHFSVTTWLQVSSRIRHRALKWKFKPSPRSIFETTYFRPIQSHSLFQALVMWKWFSFTCRFGFIRLWKDLVAVWKAALH